MVNINLYVIKGPHSNDTIGGTRKDGVHWIPLVVLRETDAENVLRSAHLLTHKSVDAGQRVAIDGPQVKPSTRTGGNVTRQFVDGDGSERRTVPTQLANKRQSAQIPDDGRTIARTRYEQLVASRSCQTSDGLRVAVEMLTDSKLLLSQVPHSDHCVGRARDYRFGRGADAR